MAKSKEVEGLEKVDVEGSVLDVTRVYTPDEPTDEWHKAQAEALMTYKATGSPGVYIDPTRDQEPDIAPELGVSPHPELANPAPPASSFSGRALDVNSNPVLVPAEEKADNAKDATEAFNEQLQAREEFMKNQPGGSPLGPPMPVVIVEQEEPVEGALSPGPDESPKSRDGDPEAQLPNASDSASVEDAKDASEDKRSDSGSN